MSGTRNYQNVAKVLFLQGDNVISPAAQEPFELLDKQFGIFDAETGLSIVPDGNTAYEKVFMAVGDGVVNGEAVDIDRSAGMWIQMDKVRNVNVRCASLGQEKIIQIGGIVSKCGTQFGLKLDLSNNEVLRSIGNQRFFKYFTTETSPCTGCEDCPSADGKELVQNLWSLINNDEDGYFTANRVSNDGLTVWANDGSGQTAFDAYDAVTNGAPQLRIQVNLPAVAAAAGIDYNYFYPRELDINAYPVEGFGSNFDVTEIQALAYSVNSGYDLRWLEYETEGNDGNPGPYRVTESGVVLSTDHKADQTLKYITVSIEYDNASDNGLLNYQNPISTVLAINCAYKNDGTPAELTSILNALDNLFAPWGFSGVGTEVGACDCDTVN
jgi:hypothetical protein